MIEVYAVKIDEELNYNKFNRLISWVSREKREKIKEYRRFEDAKRTLIGEILARFLICKKINLMNDQLLFSKNEFGKPLLKNSEDFHFNISHSGQWVVCATHNQPIGIDIEQIKPIDIDIAKRYFSEIEYRDIIGLTESERLTYFYELWTLKESYIKAIGKGLSIPLNSFSIRSGKGNIEIITKEECSYTYFKQYKIDYSYKMSVCANKNEFCNNTVNFTLNQFYEEVCQYEFFKSDK